METNAFVIMGVSGCGKTSIGRALAFELGWDFFDADDFHPPANIEKMTNGIPLTDDDRAPWLNALHEMLSSNINNHRPCVLACSALKKNYRQILLGDLKGIQVIYLKGNYELILTRLQARADHYMKPALLKSQFDSLEEPQNALWVDASQPVDEIVKIICRKGPV
jgi:gluconokinase